MTGPPSVRDEVGNVMTTMHTAVPLLGLSNQNLNALLDRTLGPRPERESLRNRHGRPYRLSTGVILEVLDAGASPSCTHVVPRDISAEGMGLLVQGWIAAGTPVGLHLPLSDENLCLVRGTVVRCFSLTGDVCDVGVQFDEPIEITPILRHAM
jgi:hypothetical protein